MSNQVEKRVSEETGVVSADPTVPARVLVGVFLASLFLTFAAIETSRHDLGGYHLHVALGIAAVQASPIALFFMRLLWERPVHGIILFGTLVLVAVFLALCVIDTRDSESTLDPISPLVQEKLDQGRESLADPDS